MAQNKQIKYPRLVANSELATNKSLANTEIIDLRNEDKRQELTRKNYNYNVSYAYAMDGISAYCTDNATNGKIHLLENNYYSIRVTPNEWENYSLGEYVNEKLINNRFWDNFKDISTNPKTLVMVTDEGTYLGEPIRILVKRNDSNINSHGGNISNLRTWDKEQQRYVPIQNATAIEYIQIDFFKPLFKQAVEDNNNWLPLPRNLQAILDYTEINNPELLQFNYWSKYDSNKIMKISAQTARKYFLYVNANTNFLGEKMHINAVDFWKCVNPTRIRAIERENEEGKKYTTFHLKAWNEDRQAMECLTRLHRKLVDTNRLEGINFTTCGVWYNGTTGEYDISVYRKKPLTKAPAFIEHQTTPQIEVKRTVTIPPCVMNEYNNYFFEHGDLDLEKFLFINGYDTIINKCDHDLTDEEFTIEMRKISPSYGKDPNKDDWNNDVPF